MKTNRFLTGAFAVGLAGCTGTPSTGSGGDTPQERLLDIPLTASASNAGEVGRAMLVAREDQTDMTLTVSGVPPWVGRPVHLYTYIYQGKCGQLPDRPAYSLNDHVLASSADGSPARTGPFTVRGSAKVRLVTLQEASHAVLVRSGPADGNRELFCGDITKKAAN